MLATTITPEREKLEALLVTHEKESRDVEYLAKVAKEGNNQRILKMKEKLKDLAKQIDEARIAARESMKKAVRHETLAPIQRQVTEAESDLRRNQRTLEIARKRRDEIVATLIKADDRKQSAEIQRLTAELQSNREMARQLSRLAMELELKLKGIPVPDATRPADSDDKLDRVLRELAELRAEVRRLGEKK
jgi:hypothetical protein